MIAPALLRVLFMESFARVKEHADQVSHADSIDAPVWGGNCMHWIVGHIVVARCNFMMLLDVPSIWDWPTCKLFIPDSTPTAATGDHIDHPTLLADLDRTQQQLLAVLDHLTAADLEAVQEGQSIGEQLAMYASHESYHAGQLGILRKGMGKQARPLR